jgi:DNA-binding LytR/AlgR family response regulator
MAMRDPNLTACRVLIVEDDYIVARSLLRLLKLWGAAIVGPAPTVKSALSLLQATPNIDFGFLDINLRGEKAFPVADALIGRGVPFAFTTGYSDSVVPEKYRSVAVFRKPYDPNEIASLFSERE